MCDIIEVTDLAAPELDVYARLTQAQLRCAAGGSRKKVFLLRKALR